MEPGKVASAADRIVVGSPRTYRLACRLSSAPDALLRDRRERHSVDAIVAGSEPAGYTRGTHRHPAGAYVFVIDGSMIFGLDDREVVALKVGESFYEQPGALYSVSRRCRPRPAGAPIAFFVLEDGQCATGYARDCRRSGRGDGRDRRGRVRSARCIVTRWLAAANDLAIPVRQRPARGRRAPAREARRLTRVSSGPSYVVPATAAVVDAAVSTCTPAPRRRGRGSRPAVPWPRPPPCRYGRR
jgi:hypothetical protein